MTFRGDGGLGGNRLSLGNQPDKVRKKVTGSAPRKFIKKQIRPPQGDRSSSTMLVNDLSNLRDQETPLDSTFTNAKKVLKISKGDTLRNQTLERVLQNTMSRAHIDHILLVQELHENLKSVQDGLKSIADKRKKEAKAREEKESNEDPTDKDKYKVMGFQA